MRERERERENMLHISQYSDPLSDVISITILIALKR